VTAQHAGCRSADGHGAVTQTRALVVPPAVFNLRLVLRCPGLKRKPSRTTLKVHKVPVNEVVLMAQVRGGNPIGAVRFSARDRTLGLVPVDPRTHRATLAVSGTRTKGFRATYQGDGYNAPSSGVS
jgi:hypothetical protein